MCSSCGPTRGGPRLQSAFTRGMGTSPTSWCPCRGLRNWKCAGGPRCLVAEGSRGCIQGSFRRPAPAANSAGRLRQMKALADRFQVRMTGLMGDGSDREDLRMLAKPLYRAEPGTAQNPDPDWIDSGVFGFVQGTDPEAILLLEAVRQDGRPRWQYAFARATGGGLEARLDLIVVWSVERLAGETAPLKPQTIISRPVGGTSSGQ